MNILCILIVGATSCAKYRAFNDLSKTQGVMRIFLLTNYIKLFVLMSLSFITYVGTMFVCNVFKVSSDPPPNLVRPYVYLMSRLPLSHGKRAFNIKK